MLKCERECQKMFQKRAYCFVSVSPNYEDICRREYFCCSNEQILILEYCKDFFAIANAVLEKAYFCHIFLEAFRGKN